MSFIEDFEGEHPNDVTRSGSSIFIAADVATDFIHTAEEKDIGHPEAAGRYMIDFTMADDCA